MKPEVCMTPKPASVRYNDWRSVAVEPLDAFTPTMPVSVIIPYYQTPAETLARTLAGLERQTYPRDLFEVIIVDDGSEPPLSTLPATSLDVKVVRQERRGFGLARARNTGARAAAHDILLFLDSDLITDADWVASHARWHHAVSDALTLGPRTFVSMDGVEPETIKYHTGSLEDLFSDSPADPPWLENILQDPSYLDSRADNIFRWILGGNFGVSRDFYWSVGGHDESFNRWGAEDTEFCYRAYTHGALLVPVLEAWSLHQGRWDKERAAKSQSLGTQSGKIAHLIAHPAFRGSSPGRIFKVPQYVVTLHAGCRPPDEVVRAVVDILADRIHDLVVRIETPPGYDERSMQYFREMFVPDARVRLDSTRSILEDFPASPFHVTIPSGVVFDRDLVHRLHAALGDAACAMSTLSDGSVVSITRAWALHRARRAGGDPADYGIVRTIPPAKMKLKLRPAADIDSAEQIGYPTRRDILLDRVRETRRNPTEVWALLKWLAGRARRRASLKWQAAAWRCRRLVRR